MSPRLSILKLERAKQWVSKHWDIESLALSGRLNELRASKPAQNNSYPQTTDLRAALEHGPNLFRTEYRTPEFDDLQIHMI